MKLVTYLNFGGNCADAFKFYEKHLGGKIMMMMTHDQTPSGTTVSADQAKKILHGSIMIAGTPIMASDVDSARFQPMRSVYISLSVDSTPEAERIHALLAEGGEVFMPMTETFFAHRFSMLRDKFGVSWMVIHDKPAPSAS